MDNNDHHRETVNINSISESHGGIKDIASMFE